MMYFWIFGTFGIWGWILLNSPVWGILLMPVMIFGYTIWIVILLITMIEKLLDNKLMNRRK